MPPALSSVWKYFEKSDESKAKCKLCLKSVNYCGNTSNLHKHLKTHKVGVKAQTKPSARKIRKKSIDRRLSTASKIQEEQLETEENLSEPEQGSQRSVKESFKRLFAVKEGGSRHSNITNAILFFICKDMRPFNVVEGEGFLKLMKELVPNYRVPTRVYFKKQLSLKYAAMAAKYSARIDKATDISITLDIWTETMTEKSFLGVTAHFMEGITQVNAIIATRALCERHTSKYIADTLSEILEEWNITMDKVKGVTTDGAANMKAAMKLLDGDKHLICFAHTINLIVEAGLKEPSIRPTISKLREIVKWIKNSVNVSDKLRGVQMRRCTPEGNCKKMILDVATRWNSVYYMIERFMELRQICSEIISDDVTAPQMLTGRETEQLRQLMVLLKPFEYVTTESSAENYVTISKIIPMVKCLKNQLNQSLTSSACVSDVKQTLLEELQRRLGDVECNPHYALATILDPRFKDLHFSDKSAKLAAIELLRKQLTRGNSESCSDSEMETEEKQSFDFWEHHRTLVSNQRKRKFPKKMDNLSTYLSLPVASLNVNPLEEWEELKSSFPLLYNRARTFLGIMATSVPSERLFSKAGATITKTRNRLTGKHVEKLLFLSGISTIEFFS